MVVFQLRLLGLVDVIEPLNVPQVRSKQEEIVLACAGFMIVLQHLPPLAGREYTKRANDAAEVLTARVPLPPALAAKRDKFVAGLKCVA